MALIELRPEKLTGNSNSHLAYRYEDSARVKKCWKHYGSRTCSEYTLPTCLRKGRAVLPRCCMLLLEWPPYRGEAYSQASYLHSRFRGLKIRLKMAHPQNMDDGPLVSQTVVSV